MSNTTGGVKAATAAVILLALGGCATITGGTHQSLHVDTTYHGEPVTGVHCLLHNNKGSYDVVTPGSVQVHKGAILETTCTDTRYPEGFTASFPNQTGATYGNILLGGIVGIGVDTMSGAANTYHDSVHVEMGRKLFWYKDEVNAIDFATDPESVDSVTQRGAFKAALKQYKKEHAAEEG